MSTLAVETLRRQLREKFPQACGNSVLGEGHVGGLAAGSAMLREEPGEADGRDGAPSPAGSLRALWGGGAGLEFPAGAVSEVVGVGAGWVVAVLLEGMVTEPGVPELVLVDGADGFDPASFSDRDCARLLWVRCRKSALEMVKAADWVLRDGNVPLVVMDASGLEPQELASVPASAWWRLKHGTQRGACRLVVVAARPLVPMASRRWRIQLGLRLEDFTATRHELLARLRVVAENCGRAGEA